MKIGDLVMDDFYEEHLVVLSEPRISLDCEVAVLGVMSGDIYYVIDVMRPCGEKTIVTVDELELISESR